jgi:predicted dithiol-disulfide oxidoreductase (DUF899 family)
MTTDTARDPAPARPRVVGPDAWQRERDDLLVAEKEATRLLDGLAARRRRLPMVRFDATYAFDGPDGTRTLLDLFDGRHQLAVYQFMDVGPDAFCPGCTWLTKNVTALDDLAASGVSWATVSEMPLAQIQGYRQKMGWDLPFYSSRGSSFAADCGVDGGFMLSMFLRDGDQVYRTWNTTSRGVDRLLFVNNMLDLAVYGRQEDWEDSPDGWPQEPTYG